MPLHRIYHPNTTFTEASEREGLANAICDVYARIPRFFVNVIFIAVDPSNIYVGGKPQTNWCRFTVEHIAIQMPPDLNDFHEFVTRYEAAIKPFIGDKGIEHEISFDDVPHQPWRINGIRPPDLGTPAWSKWMKDNKVSSYTEEEGRRPDGKVVDYAMIAAMAKAKISE